jgi:hypothetical protein
MNMAYRRNAAQALVRIQRDLRPLRDMVRVRIMTPDGEWFCGIDAKGDSSLLLAVNDSTHRFDASATSDAILVGFASYLRDAVADVTQQPWPRVTVAGHDRVLDARLVDGRACWCAGDDIYCDIGSLCE